MPPDAVPSPRRARHAAGGANRTAPPAKDNPFRPRSIAAGGAGAAPRLERGGNVAGERPEPRRRRRRRDRDAVRGVERSSRPPTPHPPADGRARPCPGAGVVRPPLAESSSRRSAPSRSTAGSDPDFDPRPLTGGAPHRRAGGKRRRRSIGSRGPRLALPRLSVRAARRMAPIAARAKRGPPCRAGRERYGGGKECRLRPSAAADGGIRRRYPRSSRAPCRSRPAGARRIQWPGTPSWA